MKTPPIETIMHARSIGRLTRLTVYLTYLGKNPGQGWLLVTEKPANKESYEVKYYAR